MMSSTGGDSNFTIRRFVVVVVLSFREKNHGAVTHTETRHCFIGKYWTFPNNHLTSIILQLKERDKDVKKMLKKKTSQPTYMCSYF